MLIRDREGTLLYDEFAHAARAGWNNIYLCENRYLLTLHIEDRGTFGEFDYQVFRLDTAGNPVVKDADTYIWESEESAEGNLDTFSENLQQYLQESYLLLSTQEGELHTEHVSEAEKYRPDALREMVTNAE